MKLKQIYFSLFLMITINSYSQTEIFVSKISFSEFELSNFMSSIALDEEAVYFIANDFKLYCIDKKVNFFNYTIEIDCKTDEPVYVFKESIISAQYLNKIQKASVYNKKTGKEIQKLNVSPLRTPPQFLNDSIFVATTINKEGGQLFAYDLHNNALLWGHFVGHGFTFKPYMKNETIIAKFDYDEWKTVGINGEIEEEIVEEYETNNKMKLLHVFFELSHDNIEITQEFLSEYFLNTEDLKVKISTKNTVLLSQEKILILGNDSKVISNIDLENIVQLPDEGENDYLEILKIETDNVWFFYQNQVVNYNFKKNKVIKTYDVTKWNAHQVLLEGIDLWLISATDGQLYHIKLEITKKELAEKAARIKKEKEQGYQKPDKARIEAAKAAEEIYKQKK